MKPNFCKHEVLLFRRIIYCFLVNCRLFTFVYYNNNLPIIYYSHAISNCCVACLSIIDSFQIVHASIFQICMENRFHGNFCFILFNFVRHTRHYLLEIMPINIFFVFDKSNIILYYFHFHITFESTWTWRGDNSSQCIFIGQCRFDKCSGKLFFKLLWCNMSNVWIFCKLLSCNISRSLNTNLMLIAP